MTSTQQLAQNLAEKLVIALEAPALEERLLQLCQKYPSSIIQKALIHASKVPAARIKKTRVALFIYLVKRYAHTSPHHPRY